MHSAIPNQLALGSFPSEGMTPLFLWELGVQWVAHKSQPTLLPTAPAEVMRCSLRKMEVIATFLSRINQVPTGCISSFYQKAKTIWRRNPAFPNQSFCAVFTSKFSHFWSPKSGHLLPQILRTQALGKSKRWVFHEEVEREGVNWDSPAVGAGLAQENISSHHSKTHSVATSVYNSNDKNPPGHSFVRHLPGSVYFPRIWWRSRKIMFILAATAVHQIILCFMGVWL